MGEERLIEITSEIIKLEGPLWTMGYVTSLNDSEIYLLLKYVGSSKYHGLNLCDAIFAFSYDYLKSKGIEINSLFLEGYDKKVSNDDINDEMLYVNKLLSGNKQVSGGRSGRK